MYTVHGHSISFFPKIKKLTYPFSHQFSPAQVASCPDLSLWQTAPVDRPLHHNYVIIKRLNHTHCVELIGSDFASFCTLVLNLEFTGRPLFNQLHLRDKADTLHYRHEMYMYMYIHVTCMYMHAIHECIDNHMYTRGRGGQAKLI